MILLFIDIVVVVGLYVMVTHPYRRWVRNLGIVLTVMLVVSLSIRLGYTLGDRWHSREPPPIQVFL